VELEFLSSERGFIHSVRGSFSLTLGFLRSTFGSFSSERGSFSPALGAQQSRAWFSAIGAWVFFGHALAFLVGGWLFSCGTSAFSAPAPVGRVDRQHSRARKHGFRLRSSAFSTYTRGVGEGWRTRYAAPPAKRAGFPDITSKEWT